MYYEQLNCINFLKTDTYAGWLFIIHYYPLV